MVDNMNFFAPYDWESMLKMHVRQNYNISDYHEILCPREDWPAFLDRYIKLPLLQRLSGVGLLCGTDWTPLYKNRFFYSRLDHSIGVALIVWHFTHDKAQTIAGLLHDISTPVFSHVSDFRKGDALTQTVTEEPTAAMVGADAQLAGLLAEDNLTARQVEDYHIYPIADNEIPQLSADRLEYMFPSGMALDGSWTMEEIRLCYNDLVILKNEEGLDELGFKSLEIAELYCQHFCMIGHILQLNENKLTLHMLGQIMNLAEKEGLLSEADFMSLSEREVMERLDEALARESSPDLANALSSPDSVRRYLARLYKTFRTMTRIEHTEEPLGPDYFCVNLKVKLRYIDPLVIDSPVKPGNDRNYKSGNDRGLHSGNYRIARRLSQVSEKARRIIEDFKSYSDTACGCVKLV